MQPAECLSMATKVCRTCANYLCCAIFDHAQLSARYKSSNRSPSRPRKADYNRKRWPTCLKRAAIQLKSSAATIHQRCVIRQKQTMIQTRQERLPIQKRPRLPIGKNSQTAMAERFMPIMPTGLHHGEGRTQKSGTVVRTFKKACLQLGRHS